VIEDLAVAGRWFASSKTCSGCGTAKAKLALSERTYACTCGSQTASGRGDHDSTSRP
jgi:transposase